MPLYLIPLISLLMGDGIQGRATVYWPGDGYCGKWRADGGIFLDTDDHITHRTLPLGTSGLLCNLRTSECTKTVVRDRGPYGATKNCKFSDPIPSGVKRIKSRTRCRLWQTQGKLKPGWRRRGEFDLTRPVAEAIKHRAFDKVVFLVIENGKVRNAKKRRAEKGAGNKGKSKTPD